MKDGTSLNKCIQCSGPQWATWQSLANASGGTAAHLHTLCEAWSNSFGFRKRHAVALINLHIENQSLRVCHSSAASVPWVIRGMSVVVHSSHRHHTSDNAPIASFAQMGRRRLHSLLYLLALVAGIAVFHAFHGNFQNAGGFTQRSSDCEPYCFYNQDDARLSMALDLQKEDRDFTGMDHTSVVVLGENDQPSANSMLKDIARNVEREAAAKDILEVRPSTAVDTQSPLKPKVRCLSPMLHSQIDLCS